MKQVNTNTLVVRGVDTLTPEEKAVSRVLDVVEEATGKVVPASHIEVGRLGRPDNKEFGARLQVWLKNGHTLTFHGFGYAKAEALEALADEVSDLFGIDTLS